jgi:putative ABC transport system permease protein
VTPRPPRLAQLIVSALVKEPDCECLLGDLDEQFADALRRGERLGAWRRYWSQSLRSAWQARSLNRRAAPARRRSPNMGNLWRDVRLAVRTARLSPGYSAIVAVTIALALGANTLVFSLANPLIIRPLPLKDQNTLGWIWDVNAPTGVDRGRASLPDLLDWRTSSQTFASLAGFETHGETLTGNGDAVRVQAIRTTVNLPEMWGLHPVLGRLFEPGEDVMGQPLVGILSYRYWQKAFHADRDVLGRTLFLDGRPLTIVGVMDSAIEIGAYATYDLWAPLPLDPAVPRDQRTIRVMGRLAPGATLASADAELHGLAQGLARDHAATNLNWDAHVVSTTTALTGPNAWILLTLLGVVVMFVLLIACANLANLVLARIVARQREFAVRQAIGASRVQLIRPLLIESTLLGLVGGGVGLEIAHMGLRVINAAAYETYLQRVGINSYVLAFTVVLSLFTPILFSLWPALSAGRANTVETLRDGRGSGGRATSRRRAVLAGGQVALALSLLVVSALVVRTTRAYARLDLGLDISHLLAFGVELPRETYPDAAAWARFADNTTRDLHAMAGTKTAAAVSHLPVFDTEITQTLSGTKHDSTRDSDRPWVSWFSATPPFFEAAGIHLVAGRLFDPADSSSSLPVAVLSRTAAEKYFDRLDEALGRAIIVHGRGAKDRTVTVVGVVADTHNSDVTGISPQLFVPFVQWPVGAMTLLVNSARPASQLNDVRLTMRRLDPALAISDPETLTQRVQEYISENRILDGLFVGFGLLALILTAVGLYGVISYSVGQRRQEIGVRMALGAAPATIRWMVLRDGLRVISYGIGAGLVLAALLGRASASVLYGVSATDPATFGTVAAFVGTVAIVAVWVPAMRAMRIDPVRSLKAE